MTKFIKKNSKTILIVFSTVLISSLFFGFATKETISGAGARGDFYFTWNYILELENSFVGTPGKWTIHTPLHYILLSKIYQIVNSQELVRFISCLSALLIPILFYQNLKIKYPEKNKNILVLLSLSIFLYPAFRYSAIWANDHITGLIFFLLSTLNFLKWKNKKINKINLHLLLSVIFLSLALYARQYYAFIFIYYLFIFIKKLKLKEFLKVSFYIFLLSLPGFWLIFNFPILIKNAFFTPRFQNSLLINFSIIGFYLLPFCLPYFFWNKNIIFRERKKILKIFLISFVFILFLLTIGFDYFNYNPGAGGGFYLKLSYFLLGNLYLFYLTSFFGLFFILYICIEDKKVL